MADISEQETQITQWVRDALVGASRQRAQLDSLETQLQEDKLDAEKRSLLEQQQLSLKKELAALLEHAPTDETTLKYALLWQDLALVTSFTQQPVQEVRKAIHRIIRHLDPVQGLTTQVVQEEPLYPLSETTYASGASTPFLLALAQYRFPFEEGGPSFHDSSLGKCMYQALYAMLDIDEVVSPIEAGQIVKLGRQRIYEIARDHPERLTPIYKQTRATMTAHYLLAQAEQLKREKEDQYANRRRPGPVRPARTAKEPFKQTHEEILSIVDAMLSQQAQKVQQSVLQLGGTSLIPQESLRTSPLGVLLLSLVDYLENPAITAQEKEASRQQLNEVLMSLYGRPRVPLAEETSPFGEVVNRLRIKGTKMPEILNVSELISYLTQQTAKKYFLVDVYSLRRAQRLWPLRVHGKHRYLKQEAATLCEELLQEQQEAKDAQDEE